MGERGEVKKNSFMECRSVFGWYAHSAPNYKGTTYDNHFSCFIFCFDLSFDCGCDAVVARYQAGCKEIERSAGVAARAAGGQRAVLSCSGLVFFLQNGKMGPATIGFLFLCRNGIGGDVLLHERISVLVEMPGK